MNSIFIIKKINSFKNLKKGWNGYSADPPSIRAIGRAVCCLSHMYNFSSDPKNKTLLPSRVAPSAIGGIGVTFVHKDMEVYVEFYNNGEIYTMFCNRIDPDYESIIYKGCPKKVEVVNDEIELVGSDEWELCKQVS